MKVRVMGSGSNHLELENLEDELKKIEAVQMMEAIKSSALMTVKDNAQSKIYSDGLPTKFQKPFLAKNG